MTTAGNIPQIVTLRQIVVVSHDNRNGTGHIRQAKGMDKLFNRLLLRQSSQLHSAITLSPKRRIRYADSLSV